jgi:hypothetical protein
LAILDGDIDTTSWHRCLSSIKPSDPVDAALADANCRLLNAQAINSFPISKGAEFWLMMQKMGVVRTMKSQDDPDEAVKQN